MSAYLVAVAVIAGLLCGRLAAVAVVQIPAREAIFGGWNRCSHCHAASSFIENLPLARLARPRCSQCGERIGLRYPLVELAAAVLFGLSAWKFGWHLETVVYALFFWVLLVLSMIDLEHKLLPDRVVFPSLLLGAAGLGIAAVVRGYPMALLHAAVGAVIFGGFLFVVAFIYPAGMGGGDVKLSFLLGMFLGYLDGWGVVVTGMFLSFVLGGVIGVIVMAMTGGGRKMQVPFGPFLALGTVVAVFLGHEILAAYLG
ncbi:MAG: leader peptidase (prepilin peptidase) / N-methyltransferase [Actinomycetota bacterium]|nr:leader peptidase (prepilin peptidase) / N-methyltransferase [Actinomycetota bacterium]